jgi:ABC-type lipoprotein export system ATPase subunit
MAHLTGFEIHGLVGRHDIVVQNLQRDLNVFYGLNGSGKTTLLRILDSAMSCDARRIRSAIFRHARAWVHSPESRQTFELTITRPSVPDANFAWSVSPERMPGRGWAHRFLPTSRLVVIGERGGPYDMPFEMRFRPETGGPEDREELLDKAFEAFLDRRWALYNSEILSRVKAVQEEGLARILEEVLVGRDSKKRPRPVPDHEAAYNRVASFLKRQRSKANVGSSSAFRHRLSDDPLLQNVVGHIDNIEAQIDVAQNPVKQLQILIGRLFSGGKSVNFGATELAVNVGGDLRIGVGRLSSGEKHLVQILLEGLIVGGNCLMIDEPEISMHIDWQRELLGDLYLLNPNAQVIVATHSPEIFGRVDDSRVFPI